MAEYINRVDAINALCSDEADESMTKYLDGVYGRLMAIPAASYLIDVRDVTAAMLEVVLDNPRVGITMMKVMRILRKNIQDPDRKQVYSDIIDAWGRHDHD